MNVGKMAIYGSLALGLASCVTTAPAGSVDRRPISLETRFYQVAFFDEENGREWPLDRREGTFHVTVKGGTTEDEQRIQALLDQIAEATGLDAAIIPAAPADVIVKFISDAEWQETVSRLLLQRTSAGLSNEGYTPTCGYQQYSSPSGPYGVVQIPASHRGAERAQCIAQEISHGSGLTFDTDGRSDTVFGGATGATELQSVDYQLLRILYDPRLQPGMTWEEARPNVRQIIAELEADS